MQSRPQMIILGFLCVLIVADCADAISSDSLLIKRVLAANQLPADASGSSVSVDTDNRTVLRAQDAGDHRARPANGGGSPGCKNGSSTTTSTSTPDTMAGDRPIVDHATSSNRNSRVRRSPFPTAWFGMTCPEGQKLAGGKCTTICRKSRNPSKTRKS